SKIGLRRPLAEYVEPIPRMKAPGDSDGLGAAGLSLPVDDVAGAITFTVGRTAWSVSQQRASRASYAAGLAGVPSGPNCSCQKALLFGSFQMTTSLIAG